MFTKHKWKMIEVQPQHIIVDCDPENEHVIAYFAPEDAENMDIVIAQHNKVVDLMEEEIAKRNE
jgi:hypothetical protein